MNIRNRWVAVMTLAATWCSTGSAAPTQLDFSTYLGAGVSSVSDLAVRPDGSIVFAAVGNRLFTPTIQYGESADPELVVATVSSDGSKLLNSVGVQRAAPMSIALDHDGNIIVGGYCWDGFYTTNALQGGYSAGGLADGFVLKIDNTGTNLLWSTRLKGRLVDMVNRVAVDSANNIFAAGNTESDDFPVVHALQSALSSDKDGFLARISPDGQRMDFCTYIGAEGGPTRIYGLTVDPVGNPILTGRASSVSFPGAGSVRTAAPSGSVDAFILKLKADGSDTMVARYLGGSDADTGLQIATDPEGDLVILGRTFSTDFPLKNPVQSVYKDYGDLFLTKLSPDASTMRFSTYIGSGYQDVPEQKPYPVGDFFTVLPAGLAVDSSGNSWISTSIGDTNILTANPIKAVSENYTYDAYLAKFSTSGEFLVGSYFGGAGPDLSYAVRADPSGGAVITGVTAPNPSHPFFPTTSGAFALSSGTLNYSGFLAHISEAAPLPPLSLNDSARKLTGTQVTVAANNSGLAPGGGPNGISPLFWTWTAPADGILYATTSGTGFDTLLRVSSLSEQGSMSLVSENDDDGGPFKASFLQATVTKGGRYLIEVLGKNGAEGPTLLSLNLGLPPNDRYENRATLQGETATVEGSNIGATPYEDGLNSFGRGVWWKWTAPRSGYFVFSTKGSDFDTYLIVTTNAPSAGLEKLVESNNYIDSSSRAVLKAVAGAEYGVFVDGVYGDTGHIKLTVEPAARPVNDDIADATLLTGTSALGASTTVDATKEAGEDLHERFSAKELFYNNDSTLWWKWTAPLDGVLILTTPDSFLLRNNEPAITRVGVFEGNSVRNLTTVALGGSNNRVISTRVEAQDIKAGHEYHIVVDVSGDDHPATVHLQLQMIAPPKIIPGSSRLDPEGHFHAQVQGVAGKSYKVQRSSVVNAGWNDLAVGTFNTPDGTFSFTDSTADGKALYYRILEVAP